MGPIPEVDFFMSSNKDIWALKPSRNGRFPHMCLDGPDEDLVWIFGETTINNRIVDTLSLRVLHGDLSDFKKIKAELERWGLSYAYQSFYVPCSNGHERNYYGDWDWPEADLARRRIDTPMTVINAYLKTWLASNLEKD